MCVCDFIFFYFTYYYADDFEELRVQLETEWSSSLQQEKDRVTALEAEVKEAAEEKLSLRTQLTVYKETSDGNESANKMAVSQYVQKLAELTEENEKLAEKVKNSQSCASDVGGGDVAVNSSALSAEASAEQQQQQRKEVGAGDNLSLQERAGLVKTISDLTDE